MKGQNSLKEWFDAARPTLHEVSLLIGALTKGFFEFGKGNTVAPLLKQVREELLPALGDIIKALQGGVSSSFVDLLTNISKLIANLVGGDGGSSALKIFIDTLNSFVKVLNKIAENPAGAAIIKALAVSLGTLAAVKFAGAVTGLNSLAKAVRRAGKGENLIGKLLGFKGEGKDNTFIAKRLDSIGKAMKSGLGKVFSTSAAKKAVSGFGKGIATGLKGLGSVVARGFARLGPIIARALLGLGRVILAASPWLLLVAGLALAIYLIVKHWDKIKEVFSKAIGAVVNFIKKHWELLLLLAGPFPALIGQIIKHWDKIKKIFSKVIGAIGSFVKKHWKDILLFLVSPFAGIIKLVADNWDKIVGVFKKIPDRLKKLARFFKDAGKTIIEGLLSGLAKSGDFAKSFAKTIYNAIRKVVNFGIDKLNSLLEVSVNTHIPGVGTVGINPKDIPGLPEAKFAKGGHVPGSGNRDTVRALLTPGEFVVRKDAVKTIGVSTLQALNEGRGVRKRRRYAKGGYVDEPMHFASGGEVLRRRRRRRPGEGVLGDDTVQRFHKGGPVLGMKAGAKGDWVKALELMEHVKQDGTWDKTLDTLLKRNGTGLYKRNKVLDMPEDKDQSLIAWLLGAKVKSVPKTHRVKKGETAREILKVFYGSASETQFKALMNLNHLGQTKKEVRTPGGPGRSLQRAQSFAKHQSGKPYIWGAVGPDGYDCSGYQSAIINVLHGRNPYHRLFATATEAGYLSRNGFRPGMGDKNDYSIGWYTGSPGHTAGTLGTFNVESTGSHVRNGSAARGAQSFSRKMHMSLEGSGGGTHIVVGGKKYTLDSKLPSGKVLKLPSGSTTGSRGWVETARRFKVPYETLYGWSHGILDRLKETVPPEKMTNFLKGYNSWNLHQGSIFDSLNKKMHVPAVPPKTFTNDSQKALTHVLAHAYGRPHGDLSYRPWQALSPVEAALQQQLNQNERERQFESALTTLANWGYDSLVDDLISKGVDDDGAFNTAIDAAKKKDLAQQLNDAIAKGTAGLSSEELRTILDMIAFLQKSKGGVGLRQLSRFLGLSDYEAVKMFEKAQGSGRLAGVPNTAQIQADIVAYRNGTFYANTGGMVPGSGNTDTVPAMLTPGEFVLKKKAAQALGLNNLMALNNVQKFAKGGLVMAPTISKIPTNASSGGMNAGRLVSAGSVVNNTQVTYDVDIINPIAEPSTQSLTKLLQRRGAMGRMGSVKNDE
jgi:hypothetical protein